MREFSIKINNYTFLWNGLYARQKRGYPRAVRVNMFVTDKGSDRGGTPTLFGTTKSSMPWELAYVSVVLWWMAISTESRMRWGGNLGVKTSRCKHHIQNIEKAHMSNN